jgi:hypothetical protein
MDHVEIDLCRVVTSVDPNGIEYVCGVRMPCMRHWDPNLTEADVHGLWEAEHPNGDPIVTR